MQTPLAILADGKKFMWDGVVRETQADAEQAAEAYRADGFEVRMVADGEKFRLYTRRPVKQGPPS